MIEIPSYSTKDELSTLAVGPDGCIYIGRDETWECLCKVDDIPKVKQLMESLSTLSTKYTQVCDERDSLQAELAETKNRLHGAQMCTVCAGDKESAKRINCICGGIGTIWAENEGLRQLLAETRDFKAELEHILKNTQAELAAVREECNKLKEGPSP